MEMKSKIDSLGLFLPLDMVDIKNVDDYTTIKINKGTGEELGETLPSMFFEEKGIATSIKIETKPFGRAKMVQGVSFPINAKMLGSNYFDGVNSNNLRDVHGYLNSLSDDFSVSMDNLLKARASDIDFCCDGLEMSKTDFSSFKKELSVMCQSVGIMNYNPSKDGQFYIQTRQTARDTTPFGKIYQKGFEYIGSKHQEEFFKNSSKLENYTRAEVTMKNKAHLTRFSKGGIKNSNFLSVIEGDYSSIVSNVFEHYFVKSEQKMRTRMIVDTNKIRGYDSLFYSQFLAELERCSLDNAVDELKLIDTIFYNNTIGVPLGDARTRRTRRKQIENIFYTYFCDEKGKQIESFNNYIRAIGLMN